MSKPIKLVETYSFHSAKDKLITRRIQHPDIDNCKFEKDISLSVLTVVTEDFNLEDKIDKILDEKDSYQIRPKALYKSKRGYFYKDEIGRRYLSNQEIIDLKMENEELGKYLEM